MEAKSPTASVKSREIIGVDQFSQRREVFDKHDTVFLPPASPLLAFTEVEPILTSNHGKTTANFKRNTPGYSSMRESRTDERMFEFRPRKYSDNFTSENNQSDDVDYRRSMTERTRRLSKLRRDFLNSNLHEPGADTSFSRTGVRASLPASSAAKYKIESPNLYKFPFAEPYSTPPPQRKVLVDLGPTGLSNGKENEDPENPRHKSLPNNDKSSKIDHQKLFEELVKRYSPQRKPVDWKLPPTRPRVVGSVPKSFSSIESAHKIDFDEHSNKPEEDDVFVKKETQLPSSIEVENKTTNHSEEQKEETVKLNEEPVKLLYTEILEDQVDKGEPVKDRTTSVIEQEEKNDKVPDLSTVQITNKDTQKRPSLDKYVDLTIPALIDKMTEEAEDLENHEKQKPKIKRKRSFLDKLLGRKKNEK